MDLIFVGLAWACLLLSPGRFRDSFLCLLVAEFCLSAAWIQFPATDPWWFLSYAGQNCVFVWLVMHTNHRLAREYSFTLVASALLAVLSFCEYYWAGRAIYDARPGIMAWICTYQLLLAAAGTGLVAVTPLEAAHGVVARRRGRRRGSRAGNPARSMGRGL